ncbi:MAG: hypothetical protein IJS46_03700, partial [Kiritimatiellae bacterium]|nr:hypothetical protein [Kiritimatiellia bacterium]
PAPPPAALGTWAKRAYAATDVSGGRTLAQISVHSPDWHAFFDPFYFSHSPEQFHMGVFLPALLAVAGLVAALRIAFPRTARRRGAAAAALVMACAIVFAFFLAMGVNGPMDGLPLRIVPKLVPPFRMVRQPLKVFCLLPTLYSAFFAASFAGLRSPPGRFWRALRIAAFLAIPCAAFVSVSRGMHLGLCALPGKNAAYETVVECAQRRGDAAPRAIALPIWPGDSSWSSIYQYCASKSGLRMVNGYAAVVNMDYFENVFRAFETMTEGEITDAMLEKLRAMGASAVILHENAFPAKVSPFPFGVTLRRFLADRRLRLLASGGGAWAFEIKDAAEVESETPAPDPAPSFFQPSRAFALCPPSTNAAVRIRSFSPIHANGFGWLVRAGDGGRLVLSATAAGPDGSRRIGETLVFDEPAQPHGVADGHRLAWLPACPAGPDLKTGLETPGSAIITHVAYTAEQYWNIARKDDGSLEIPVCDMAHRAGETVVETRENKSGGTSALQPCALEFRPLSFRPGEVVFGPQLPLPFAADSILEARLKADTPGADGTDGAALWISAVDGCETIATIPSGSKRPNGLVFRYDGTSPVCFHLSAEPHDRPERLRAVEIYVRTPSRAP